MTSHINIDNPDELRTILTRAQGVLAAADPISVKRSTKFNTNCRLNDSECCPDEMKVELAKLDELSRDRFNVSLEKLVDDRAGLDITQSYIFLFENQIEMRHKLQDVTIDLSLTRKYHSRFMMQASKASDMCE